MKVTDIKTETIKIFQYALIDIETGEADMIEFTNIPKEIAVNLINQQIDGFNLVGAVKSVNIINTNKVGTWIDVETTNHILKFCLYSI